MKKFVLLLAVLLLPSLVFAQTFISVDFSGNFPPSGWSADSHGTNWHANDGNEAGGVAPEAVFDWSPQFSGLTRFMSPQVDLTGVTSLNVEFKHMVDHYSGAYTIGVATRHGGGTWHTVWQVVNPTGNIGPTSVLAEIDNEDVGTSDFQICWFFSGTSYNIDYWYIDDIKVFQPLEHDVKVSAINVQDQYTPGSDIVPTVVVNNFGLNPEVFSTTCEIMVGEESVYSQTITGTDLDPGESRTLNFPEFTADTPDELYRVVATTELEGDLDPDNDSLGKWFNTYTTNRDMVVVEIGTGTWCQYCPGAAMGAEDLVDNGCNVAVVEYHNGDAFVNTYSDQRNAYYGITGFPTAVFDGVQKFIGGDHNQSMYSYYLPIFQARNRIKSAFTMEVGGTNDGNNYDLTVRVTKMAPIPYDNLVLHVALTESGIQYNWQGQTHLEWVERLMVPNANGTAIDMMNNDVLDVNLHFVFNNSWSLANSELSVFIQNLDNKEILQGHKLPLPDLVPIAIDEPQATLPAETKLIGNYPNPFNPSTTIQFSLQENSNVSLEVYDILGRKVSTLTSGELPAGNHTILWNGTNDNGEAMASGVYFYRLSGENFNQTKKMILMK